MPRTRSHSWSELKIGVLMIIAVGITVLTVFLLTGGKGFFWQRYYLKSRFPNVAGLKPGSPVRLAGVEVGDVEKVELAGDQVDVVFQVNRDYRDRITTDSIAKLGSVSLLGESAVDITPAGTGTAIPEWGYVPQGRPAAQLADVTDQASQGINELTGLIHDLRTGKGTAGMLLTDQQLYVELNRFVGSANALTTSIQQGKGTLGKLVNDPKAAEALEASLKNVQEMTNKLNAGEGSLGQLLRDDTFARNLNSASNNLNSLVAKLNSGEGTAGKLITDPALFNQLNNVTQSLNQLMTNLNSGEGSIGRLLKDKQLYENMNAAVADLRTLIANIEKDPRRYLNIRVSVF
jgi:phospholipid/cholesterol/gamma-HCH transport system substrate-binding protein